MSVTKLTTGKIRQGWKKELTKRGFRLEGPSFVRERGVLRQVIGVQRNMLSPRWKTNLFIEIIDQFREPPEPTICLHGNVTLDDARFFEKDGSWWTEDLLPGQLDAIVQFGVPWLDDFASPAKLIGLFEKAVEQCARAESLLEPLQNQEFHWPKWIKTAYESPPSPPRPAPMYFYLLSLLYYATGNFERGCDRATIWLDHARDGRTPGEPARTLRLMADMGCKNENPSR
jgi:hypothetical protein